MLPLFYGSPASGRQPSPCMNYYPNGRLLRSQTILKTSGVIPNSSRLAAGFCWQHQLPHCLCFNFS